MGSFRKLYHFSFLVVWGCSFAQTNRCLLENWTNFQLSRWLSKGPRGSTPIKHRKKRSQHQRSLFFKQVSFISMYIYKSYIPSSSQWILMFSWNLLFHPSLIFFQNISVSSARPTSEAKDSICVEHLGVTSPHLLRQVTSTTSTRGWLVNGECQPWILPEIFEKMSWNKKVKDFIRCGWLFYVSVCPARKPDAYLLFASSKFKETNIKSMKSKKQRRKRGNTETK